MLQGEHSVILSTCSKLPFVIKIFVSSVFEWPLKTGSTVLVHVCCTCTCISEIFLKKKSYNVVFYLNQETT